MANVQNQLETFLARRPTFDQSVYIAPGAVVLGDVTLGDYASVWFCAVLRADINRIVIGARTNIQDHCVLHLADDYPCILGHDVTVGHSAIVHACTIGNEVLVGMGSIILDGAIIGEQSILGAGTVVTQGEVIPPGSMVLGTPGRVVRALTPDERLSIKGFADKYVHVAAHYQKHPVALPRL